MDVISIGNHHAPVTNKRGNSKEDGVQANGKQLGAKRVSLARATERRNHLRGQASVTANIQLRGRAVLGEDPRPEPREAAGNNREEGTAMDTVESEKQGLKFSGQAQHQSNQGAHQAGSAQSGQ